MEVMSPEVYNAVVEQAELEDEASTWMITKTYKNIGLNDLICLGLKIKIE